MTSQIEQKEKIRIFPCPACKKSTVYSESNPARPFCSERCKVMDTASWADESFKIPGPLAYIEDHDEEDG